MPSCAGCHSQIDPPGFALESFDVIGGWRDRYRSLGAGDRVERFTDPDHRMRVHYKLGPPVDPSGALTDGTAFKEIRDFKKLLLRDPDGLARALAGKLFAYGLGRSIGFSDREDIQRIVATVKTKNYGFRTLVHEIIQSPTFRSP